MHWRGVNYDVGRVLDGINWRPAFDPAGTRRELEIIQNDLHCNAVKIYGQDTGRVMTTAQAALRQGVPRASQYRPTAGRAGRGPDRCDSMTSPCSSATRERAAHGQQALRPRIGVVDADSSWDSPEAQRFRLALDMAEAGLQLYRQRMRREHPNASDEEIEAEVQGWLMRRPGDYPGPPSSRLPRHLRSYSPTGRHTAHFA